MDLQERWMVDEISTHNQSTKIEGCKIKGNTNIKKILNERKERKKIEYRKYLKRLLGSGKWKDKDT